jgi:hypothetical protein
MHAYGYGYTFKDYCIIALNQMSNMKILYVTQVGGEVIVAEGKKQCGGSSGVRKSKAKAAAPAPTKDPQSVVAKVLHFCFLLLGNYLFRCNKQHVVRDHSSRWVKLLTQDTHLYGYIGPKRTNCREAQNPPGSRAQRHEGTNFASCRIIILTKVIQLLVLMNGNGSGVS